MRRVAAILVRSLRDSEAAAILGTQGVNLCPQRIAVGAVGDGGCYAGSDEVGTHVPDLLRYYDGEH